MEKHIVKLIETGYLTHDVKYFRVEKPEGYHFTPGQATEVSINKPGWEKEKRPFTFTSLNEWNDLEFTIKIYKDHHGMTEQLSILRPGDELIIHDVWGAISYKGKGVFIAGGAGVTPFIAIFRQLKKDDLINGNKLIFSNKTSEDVILKDSFQSMLGANFINVLTREGAGENAYHRIDKKFLEEKVKDFDQHFYVCGPEGFTASINEMLYSLGASPETVVFEK